MEVNQLSLKIGRKINLGNLEGRSLEIGMIINMTAGDNVEQQYHSLKASLESQLDAWEHETRIKATGGSFEELMTPPPLRPASKSIPKSGHIKPKVLQQFPLTKTDSSRMKNQISPSGFLCPVCNDPMHQKEGKEYFLCTKHWGYPNQIKKGIVKDRKF